MEECSGIDSEGGAQVMSMEGEPRRSQSAESAVGTRGADWRNSAGELLVGEAPDAVAVMMRDTEEELGAAREQLISKPLEGGETAGKVTERQGMESEQEMKLHTGGESQIDAEEEEEECPICTEPYQTQGQRGRAMLNCDHSVCQQCLGEMLMRRADGTRVSCPLCRQRTPLLDWEIRRMQEEAVLLMDDSHLGPCLPAAPPPAQAPPPSEPGRWAELERRLESGMDMELVCGCVRYPPGFVRLLPQLKHRCRCCYLAALLLLHLAKLSCLLLVFLPVMVLVLLFILSAK